MSLVQKKFVSKCNNHFQQEYADVGISFKGLNNEVGSGVC